MYEDYTPTISEEERQARHRQRAEARRRRQLERRRQLLYKSIPLAIIAVIGAVSLSAWFLSKRPNTEALPEEPDVPAPQPIQTVEPVPEPEPVVYTVSADADTVQLDDTIDSSYAVLIDEDSGTILAEKDSGARISPASMTKVLTLLVGAEHAAGHLDDTFTMTVDITDYCYVNKCSVVGLMVGETVPVRELLYGTILPSGADAALGLAVYVSGSQEAFVELMNQKLEELGVSGTAHFTNCVGLYDENHYCTVTDMALILRAAMENDLCREVLNARKYETAPTEYHPDGQVLSNWFLRRIEDRFPGDFQIIGAKTGYVVQAGSCAVSCGQGADGKRYFCATGDASSAWRAIYDHTNLYQTYCS